MEVVRGTLCNPEAVGGKLSAGGHSEIIVSKLFFLVKRNVY